MHADKSNIVEDFAQKYDSIFSPTTQIGTFERPVEGISKRRTVWCNLTRSSFAVKSGQDVWLLTDLPQVLSILYFTPKSP